MTDELNEMELPDDYPVFPMYLYVVDGTMFRHVRPQSTVGQVKKAFGFKSFKNCDIATRKLWSEMV